MSQSPADLQRFRATQRLAYDCVTAIERELTEGITERQVARRMREWLTARGVRHYFHQPFAWFGDRTAFEGFRTALGFFPTGRRLEPGMPVILDVAPVVEGYPADIGYSCVFGDNPIARRMIADLEPYRALILQGVKAGKTLRAIYTDVDVLIRDQGFDNRHQRYPFRVLAHRVERLAPSRVAGLRLGGFGAPSLRFLFGELAAFERGAKHHSPLWNDAPSAEHRPAPGLWAVEPHLGFRGVGAKWEELLVVTESDAYWLDDDLPHVHRWRQAVAA